MVHNEGGGMETVVLVVEMGAIANVVEVLTVIIWVGNRDGGGECWWWGEP